MCNEHITNSNLVFATSGCIWASCLHLWTVGCKMILQVFPYDFGATFLRTLYLDLGTFTVVLLETEHNHYYQVLVCQFTIHMAA